MDETNNGLYFIISEVSQKEKKKQTPRHREQTCGCQGEGSFGEGRIGSLKLVDVN